MARARSPARAGCSRAASRARRRARPRRAACRGRARRRRCASCPPRAARSPISPRLRARASPTETTRAPRGRRRRPARKLGQSKRREELLRLRRHDVEGVGDDELRQLELVKVLRHQIGQPRGVDVAAVCFSVRRGPLRKGRARPRCPGRRNAPRVQQPPGLAALRRGLRHDQQAAVGEDALPEVLLLRRRSEAAAARSPSGPSRARPPTAARRRRRTAGCRPPPTR